MFQYYTISSMAEIDPEDADYVCSLTDASIEKAQRELNEDPKERLGAVKALRDWIKQQPHLTVSMGNSHNSCHFMSFHVIFNCMTLGLFK